MNADAVVANQPPVVDPGNVRLAVCGESPGIEEVSWTLCASGHGFGLEHWENRQLVTRDRCPACGSQRLTPSPRPFSGQSGRLLDDLLKDAGLPRERVWVGNVSRRPLAEHEKTLEHCRGGLARLALDLEAFKPNVVLCLGNLALSAFLGEGHSISNWRGSIFEGRLETGDAFADPSGFKVKCVAALHPAAILREPAQLALLRLDVARAAFEAASPTLDIPQRVVDAPRDPGEVLAKLAAIRDARAPVGYDIEGRVQTGITVLSFATTPTSALSIPFRRLDWSRVWSEPDESRLLEAVGGVLGDVDVPKVIQNAAYEMFCHRWLHGHRIVNIEDLMLGWHAVYPELLKDLSVIASVLTRGSFWGTPDDWGVYDRPPTTADRDVYNGEDSMRTLECWQAIQRLDEWTPAVAAYYRHQIALLEPCGEMSFNGMAYDAPARDALVAKLRAEVYALTGELDTLAGIAPPTFADVAAAVCFKNKLDRVKTYDDILTWAKPSFREAL